MRWLVDRHVKPLYSAIVAIVESGTLDLGMSPVHFFYVLVGADGVIFHQATAGVRGGEGHDEGSGNENMLCGSHDVSGVLLLRGHHIGEPRAGEPAIGVIGDEC